MNKQQLANKIWASANKMRSKIDANEYKDYILGLIFYKFLSDNEANYLLKDMKGASDAEKKAALEGLVENYEDENSKVIIDYCRNNIGYFIEYKNLFSTWLLPDSSFTVADLSVALNSFDRLVSPHYKTVYDGIFKTLQAGLSKLGENPASQTRALKDLIKDIPTDGSQDYDVLGYVYEYLIGNFAANAGKKAGEFYTPHEVAILLSEIVAEHHREKRQIEIYDPTSGSGSLLITIGKSVGRHIADKNRVKYYAQELKENTYNLTRMNLVMRGIQPGNINTRCADSLDEDWPVQKEGNEMGQPLYVDSSEAAEQYDIYATMFGGIPNTEIDAMQQYWNAFPSLRDDLFTPQPGKPYAELKVEDVKTAIEQNTDVKNFTMQFAEAFHGFADRLHQVLIDNVTQVHELQAQDEIATDIFRRLAEIPLVDKYAAYQALADQWQAIISDIETIQEEGMEAVRTVETAYKMVKKNDEDIEVPDGLKGRILPFELVQRVKFQAELDAIATLQSRVEAIGGELEEVRDSFTEEEQETYLDSEKDNAPDKKKITADAKPKADVDADTKAKLRQIDDDIAAANTELAQLVSQLTGDEFAIKGLEALINKETQL